MLTYILLKFAARTALLFALLGSGTASLANSFQPTLPPELMEES